MLEQRKRFLLSFASIFIGILAALGALSLGELPDPLEKISPH
jgi:hypothetical protein